MTGDVGQRRVAGREAVGDHAALDVGAHADQAVLVAALGAVAAAPSTLVPDKDIPPASAPLPGAATTLSSAITVEDLRSEVGYLASDALEGRMTGSKGARLAADYIADQLRQAGLKPLAKDGSYFQTFEFNSGVRVI